jgi:hypothetical protein
MLGEERLFGRGERRAGQKRNKKEQGSCFQVVCHITPPGRRPGPRREIQVDVDRMIHLISVTNNKTHLISVRVYDSSAGNSNEFELPELLPGRYRLEIVAEDAATGLNLRTAGWFSVRPPG